jgi:hypothetical protein
MENEQKKSEASPGAMRKQRVTMADGRRYMIYYTFGDDAETVEDEPENQQKGSVEEPEETRL